MKASIILLYIVYPATLGEALRKETSLQVILINIQIVLDGSHSFAINTCFHEVK